MENTERNEDALIKRSNKGTDQAVERFHKILALAPVGFKASKKVVDLPGDKDLGYSRGALIPDRHDPLGEKPGDGDGEKFNKGVKKALRNRNIAASEAYQLEVETAQLLGAFEDMLSFNRALKEAWLFGKLDTLGQSSAEKRAEENAHVVAEILPKVINNAEHERDGHA